MIGPYLFAYLLACWAFAAMVIKATEHRDDFHYRLRAGIGDWLNGGGMTATTHSYGENPDPTYPPLRLAGSRIPRGALVTESPDPVRAYRGTAQGVECSENGGPWMLMTLGALRPQESHTIGPMWIKEF